MIIDDADDKTGFARPVLFSISRMDRVFSSDKFGARGPVPITLHYITLQKGKIKNPESGFVNKEYKWFVAHYLGCK